ncbi:hypothetical protein DL96DRAFT_1734768 [Flagelloscypha sp. PMI_526]|nr:hypothetical protein DL96DRAFT_1734768 [Flagelloscypha sp. PMI_526]
MLSLAFPRFLDLPAEIQGRIWHLVASSLPSRSEQAKLLMISRSSHKWIQDVLYHSVYGSPSRFSRLISSISVNDEVFRVKTKRLLLKKVLSSGQVSDISTVISTFQALQRAYIEPHSQPFQALKILLSLPNLTELHMSDSYAKITSKEFTLLEGASPENMITRVCYIHSVTTPPLALFRCFPNMAYMLIRHCHHSDRSQLRSWLQNTTQSLQVLALLNRWSGQDIEVEAISIFAEQFGKKFGIIQFSGRRRGLSEYWDTIDDAWDGVRRIEQGETLVEVDGYVPSSRLSTK